MSPLKNCIVVFTVLGLLQVLPCHGKPLSEASENLSKFSDYLQELAEELAQQLESTVTKIDAAMAEADAKLTSNAAFLEQAWAKGVAKSSEKFEQCAPQIGKLNELSSEVISATKQCASAVRQNLLKSQLQGKLQSTVLRYAANELREVSVSCVEANEEPPLCIVLGSPAPSITRLLREGGETLGSGAARAEAYSSQILSCWRQSSLEAASHAQAIVQEIHQCANAQKAS